MHSNAILNFKMNPFTTQRSFGRFQAPVASQPKNTAKFTPGAPFRNPNSQFSSFRQNPFSQSTDFSLSKPPVSQCEDTMSVYSDSTLMGAPNLSQDSLNSFRSELCDMFKMLVETNQKNTTQMIEALVASSRKELEQSKEEYKEFKNEILEKINEISSEAIDKQEIESLKEDLHKMEKQMTVQKERFRSEIAKISESLTKVGNVAKLKKKSVRKVYVPKKLWKETTRIPPLPCICLLDSNEYLTRRQRLKAFQEGKISCKCNN